MRKTAIVPLLALVLTLPAAAPALASGSGAAISRSGHSASDGKDGRTDGRRHAKPKRIRFVAIGTVTAIDQAGSTLSLTVRGGNSKVSRGKSVDVAIADTTVIRRNGAVAVLADVLVGDRVFVQGIRTASSYSAFRVVARSAKTVDDGVEPDPTVSPAPEPTPTPDSTSTPDSTPTPDSTSTPDSTPTSTT